MRNTIKSLESRLESISRQVGIPLAFNIQSQMPGTRLRVTTLDGRRDVSPRLSPGEMDLWLNGFQMCLNELWSEAACQKIKEDRKANKE